MMELRNKVALVTGAAAGIGRATSLRLAAEGAHVGLLDINGDAAEKLARQIRADGGLASVLVANVAVAEEVSAVIDRFMGTVGQLDILVSNAGINGRWAPIDSITPEEWETVVSVNLRGTYNVLHFCVPYLKQTQGGAIVLVSSANGTRIFSSAGATAYSATKAAQVAIAKMLALELAKHRVRVNVVCPGTISTAIPFYQRQKVEAGEPVVFPQGSIPLTRGLPGKPEDVAELILFLVSDRAKHITGSPIWVDGAESLIVG